MFLGVVLIKPATAVPLPPLPAGARRLSFGKPERVFPVHRQEQRGGGRRPVFN